MNVKNSALRLIYAGLPDASFKARRIAMMQAYFDDSKKTLGKKTLFLAGYINSAEKWIDHSNRWKEILQDDPDLEYLKSAEAHALGGQFRNFGKLDRDLKLSIFAETIKEFEPWSFHISLDLSAHEKIFQNSGTPYGFKTPYWIAFEALFVGVLRLQNKLGFSEPIDFIFDRQNQIERTANACFEILLAAQPENFKKMVKSSPRFEDDKEIVALQAADMLVWHIQREYRGDDFRFPYRMPSSNQLIQESHVYAHLGEEILTRIKDALKNVWSDDYDPLSEKKNWRKALSVIEDQAFRDVGQ